MAEDNGVALELLSSEKFHQLPLEDRLGMLRKFDPSFAQLPPKEQGNRIVQAEAMFKPLPTVSPDDSPKGKGAPIGQDAGFFSTLLGDVVGMGKSLMDPVKFLEDATQARRALQDKSSQSDSLAGKVGYGIAGQIPFLGPAMAQTGEDFGQGNYGQGSAHALEILAPFLVKAIPDTIKAKTAGAVKGAIAGAGKPIAGSQTLPSAAGYAVGHHLGGGFEGGLLGAAIANRIPSMLKGAAEGWKNEPPRAFDPSKYPVQSPKIKLNWRTTDDIPTDEPPRNYNPKDYKEAPKAKSDPKSAKTSDDLQEEPQRNYDPEKYKNTPKAKSSPKSGRTTDDLNPDKSEAPDETVNKQDVSTNSPGHEAYYDQGPEYKPPITEQQIEEFQKTPRQAKANRLADHLQKAGLKADDLKSMNSEHWSQISKGADEWTPSLKTIEKVHEELLRREKDVNSPRS